MLKSRFLSCPACEGMTSVVTIYEFVNLKDDAEDGGIVARSARQLRVRASERILALV